MATCQTSRWVSTAPYVKLTVENTGNTATTATLTYSLYYISDTAASTSAARSYMVKIDDTIVADGSFNINGLTGWNEICGGTITITKSKARKTIACYFEFDFNLTWSGVYAGQKNASTTIGINAITQYAITYNANGGTGAPSAQSKWHGEAITLSSTKPTRTGYSFQGWGTSAADTTVDYQPGASYTTNAALTLYAIWKANTYTVTYNANGGTGAPAAQTKTYGTNLTLSSTRPTKTNYTFKGWATVANSSVITYQPGGTYTTNAAITLYAVWESSYVLPKIYNTQIEWATASGIDVAFDWGTTHSNPTAIIAFYDSGNTLKNSVSLGQFSGTSGHFSRTIAASEVSSLTTDASYTAKITLTDSRGASTASVTLIGNVYPIDVLAGGRGVSFGGSASLENTAHFQFEAKFDKPVYGMVKGLGRLPKIESESDLNDYKDFGVWAVYGNADAAEISNMPPLYRIELELGTIWQGRAGILEVFSPTGEGLRSAEWSYIRQRFIPYSLSYPVMERDITRDASNAWTYGAWYKTSGASYTLYDSSSGSTNTITLSQTSANFEYLEIFFTDNNGELGGYTKIHTPYTKAVNLSIIEAGGTTTYIRRTSYTISGATITPDTTNAGFVKLTGTAVSHTTGTNYIKITRVVGHKQQKGRKGMIS